MSTAERDALWTKALARKHAAIARARAAEVDAILGAHADGVPVTVIAAALGAVSRERIYAVLNAANTAPRAAE